MTQANNKSIQTVILIFFFLHVYSQKKGCDKLYLILFNS